MKPLFSRLKKYVPLPAAIMLAVTLLSLVLMLLSVHITPLADFLSGTVGLALRFLLARLTSFLPFSLFELLLVCSPLLLGLTLWLGLRRGKSPEYRVRLALSLLAVAGCLYSSYVYMLGVGYRTSPLAEKMSLDTEGITQEEIYDTALLLRDRVNELSEGLSVTEGGTKTEYGMRELGHRLCDAYSSLSEEYGFIKSFSSVPKGVMLSSLMANMGITGIYGYVTGEANVSTAYPDYTVVYTAAHEMAHQRGFAREDEANFIAFLVCAESDDPYINYCGYLSMYEYLAGAVYRADPDAYFTLRDGMSEVARADMRASAEVSLRYEDSFLDNMMDRLNDGYLKSNGTEGTVSYGYAARLAAAYFTR